MCRAALAALLLATGLGARAAEAQTVRGGAARSRELIKRAEALAAQLAHQDSLSQRGRYEELRARRFDAGNVIVLLPNAVGERTGAQIAAGAAGYLDSLGAIPPRFLSSVVVIAYQAAGWDSVVRAGGLAGRVRIMADLAAKPDTLADGWQVAAAVGRAYLKTLDDEWRAWLPTDLALGWKRGREDAAAMRELAAGDTHSGVECLGGKAAQCRLWLGLDRAPDPYAARYSAADIRVILARRMAQFVGGDSKRCQDGSDDACMRFARSGQVPPVPSGPAGTRSVLRAVRALHGAEALRRALADTSGAIGTRFARAAGIGEDSLMTEWRAWLLTGGGRPHVSASAQDAMPVLLFGGLLLFAAAGSGRWR